MYGLDGMDQRQLTVAAGPSLERRDGAQRARHAGRPAVYVATTVGGEERVRETGC
jgi:hypothetical protein